VAVAIILRGSVDSNRRRRFYFADNRINISQCENDSNRRNVVYDTAFADLSRSVNNRAYWNVDTQTIISKRLENKIQIIAVICSGTKRLQIYN